MNNLLSYYGLFDARISGSENDLPVQINILKILVPILKLATEQHQITH
jgi:hypothetical protein